MRPTATFDATVMDGTWISAPILSFVEFLDTQWGAAEWGMRQIAIVTVLVLGVLRGTCKEAYGINWYSLVHAAVTGYFSFLAVWLSVFASVPLTGVSEPLRSLSCEGPMTSLHRILPAITMGYGLFDILDAYGHGLDFLIHGMSTFICMAYFCEYDLAEVMTPMLLMEISTPHLALLKFPLFSETGAAINMGLFTLSFFLYRLLICPYLWWEIMTVTWELRNDPISQACIPWHFKYFVFCFGMVFNILNAFWGYKIIKKVVRKVTGEESIKDKNCIKKDR